MTVKTASPLLAQTNGKVEEPTAQPLTAYEQRYMRRLVDNFERAKAGVEQAQDAANQFIAFCAEEKGIVIGQDGWGFDLDHLEFVRVPAQEE